MDDTFVKSMESVQRTNAINHLLKSSGHEPLSQLVTQMGFGTFGIVLIVSILEDCGSTTTYHGCGNIFISR